LQSSPLSSSLDMPSRKKALGKARKAEKARKAPRYGSASCTHLNLTEDYTIEDKLACFNLASDFETKMRALVSAPEAHVDEYETQNMMVVMPGISELGARIGSGLFDVVSRVYCAYRQYNDQRRALFREIILSKATELILSDANKKIDLPTAIKAPVYLIHLIAKIEVMDKYDGVYSGGAVWESSDPRKVVNDCDVEYLKYVFNISHCPRESVRLVNKRNCCNCLQAVYDELKKCTER
jgi:hypothetical protein